jgi:dephospho-CoA kinase
MKSLGITGNIGSGKSSVLYILKSMGIITYDLDDVAKNFYMTDMNIKKNVLEIFPSVLSKDNQIDTKSLGQLVFSDKEKLNTLQKIIWPPIKKYISNKIDNTSKLIVFEGAVIIEAGWHKLFDYIWVIKSSHSISKQRLEKQRNLSKLNFEKILNNQLKTDEVISILDTDKIRYSIINNNSDLVALKKEIEKNV